MIFLVLNDNAFLHSFLSISLFSLLSSPHYEEQTLSFASTLLCLCVLKCVCVGVSCIFSFTVIRRCRKSVPVCDNSVVV